jgi:hypothetical protein
MTASPDGAVKQYGVCIVWADPVKAGAAKTAEEYEPSWLEFDTEAQADAFASRYRSRIGDMMPWYQGPDADDLWQDSAVERVDRATRWAFERYGEWTP